MVECDESFMKRNKIRYQAKPVIRIPITLTGEVFLQYLDDEAITQAKKGDVKCYPRCEGSHAMWEGGYDKLGVAGYFKVDVFDGKKWCLVLTQDIFPANEHHFAKTERASDVYSLCAEILRALAGRTLTRTYREHYELEVPDTD